MTISGYSNKIVDLMLGWLKGLANWVLRLFNLAGSAGGSPLMWLSQNWLKLLIFFLVLGVAMDLLIWLIRWRPYWVWFRKERVIVNDERFFASADMDQADAWEGDLASNWDEHDYVVASTVVKRQKANGGKKPQPQPNNRRREGTRVQRHDARKAPARPKAAEPSGKKAAQAEEKSRDSFFNVDLRNRDVSDSYEDEVFNVSNLPVFDEFEEKKRASAVRKRPDRRK